MKLNKLLQALVVTCALSVSTLALADNVAIKSTAMVEKVTKDASGNETKTLENATSVVPGEQVVFKNEINNQGKVPAKDIVVTNPIPEHMIFDSAYGPTDTAINYSTDGKTFAPTDKVMVKDSMTGNLRVARPEEYTFVRWTLVKPLSANTKVEVGYKATLK